MKSDLINTAMKVIFVFSLLFISQITKAQEHTDVIEPPIPIYIVCPYHEDSLKAAMASGSINSETALNLLIKKYDTLQTKIIESSAKNTAYFTWLYALIALLGTLIIALLFSIVNIRKELNQIKRIEHQQVMSSIATEVQEVKPDMVNIQTTEQKETQATSRTRKTRTKKN